MHNPDPSQLRDKMLKAGGLCSLGWGWQIPGTVPWHHSVQVISICIAIPTCAACKVVLAVQAAAGRAQTQTLMGGGPRRLGGNSVSLPPAQARHGLQQPGSLLYKLVHEQRHTNPLALQGACLLRYMHHFLCYSLQA